MTKTDIEWLEYANEFHYGNHPEINTAVKHAIEALKRTRWIPVSEYNGYGIFVPVIVDGKDVEIVEEGDYVEIVCDDCGIAMNERYCERKDCK